jgi:hypothetical protein
VSSHGLAEEANDAGGVSTEESQSRLGLADDRPVAWCGEIRLGNKVRRLFTKVAPDSTRQLSASDEGLVFVAVGASPR